MWVGAWMDVVDIVDRGILHDLLHFANCGIDGDNSVDYSNAVSFKYVTLTGGSAPNESPYCNASVATHGVVLVDAVRLSTFLSPI